jgi:hypothetical protein
LAALRVSQSFGFGEPIRAAQLAREALSLHPTFEYLRFLLAQALAFRAGPNFADWKVSDWEDALTELQPLFEKGCDDAAKLMALSLAALIHHGLGNFPEYVRMLRAFDELAERTPSLAKLVSQIRKATPRVFTQAEFNGAASVSTEKLDKRIKPDYDSLRRAFEQVNSLVDAGK